MLRATTLDFGKPVALRSPARATAQDYRPAGSVEKVQARYAFILPVLSSFLALVGCTSEDATPVDLEQQPTSSAVTPAHSSADQNEAARAQARAFATQQCLDDSSASEGVIQIVDPETDEVVGTVTVDCAEARAEQSGPSPTDDEADQ